MANRQETPESVLAFLQLLGSLGWSGATLAKKIDVSESTVSHWVTGKHEIPKVVILYLELRCKLLELAVGR